MTCCLVAEHRFGAMLSRGTLVDGRTQDLVTDSDLHAVISSLAIHHLRDPEKRRLCAAIYQALAPGGAFVNLDQVRYESPYDELYERWWLSHVRRSGAPEEQSVSRRRAHDQDASMEERLRWLRKAGFVADCVCKQPFIAVFAAIKPGAE